MLTSIAYRIRCEERERVCASKVVTREVREVRDTGRYNYRRTEGRPFFIIRYFCNPRVGLYIDLI